MTTQLLTTADMCDFALVFRAIELGNVGKPIPQPERKRPTVTQLRSVGSLETYREVTTGQMRQRLQEARLRAFCMGRVPTKRGQPKTTIATCDEEIIES